jgi:hypothetical protein
MTFLITSPNNALKHTIIRQFSVFNVFDNGIFLWRTHRGEKKIGEKFSTVSISIKNVYNVLLCAANEKRFILIYSAIIFSHGGNCGAWPLILKLDGIGRQILQAGICGCRSNFNM